MNEEITDYCLQCRCKLEEPWKWSLGKVTRDATVYRVVGYLCDICGKELLTTEITKD